MQNSDFQLYLTMISTKQLIKKNSFDNIHYFKTVSYGTLPPYITVSVQSDIILLELQQHLLQRWTAFQQRIVDELIEW